MSKEKHDRKICAENTFRGQNVCRGYYTYTLPTWGWFRVPQKEIIVCECCCHAGTSYEESMKKAKKELKQYEN